MFSRIGAAAYKKDITNTIELCQRLDDPHKKFKSIHIAGTNGKGSVSHMLAAIFQCAGYKTGLYTSPHLYDFRERIRINGVMIEKKFITAFVEKIKSSIEELQPSFFEITVAMAFDYFAEHKVDMAIIEVGLGGRLDSTNIITPLVSVITNIGWDHTHLLGNTLEAIAYEKAGIIKEHIPVIVGEKSRETDPVFTSQAKQKNAPIYFAQDRFSVEGVQLEKDALVVTLSDLHLNQRTTYTSGLPGMYQAKNVVTVLQTLNEMTEWPIHDTFIKMGLAQVKNLTGLQGRWELIHEQPNIVLDVAHNREGIIQMLLHLEKMKYQQLHIILGMVKDKEVERVLELLPRNSRYYFSQSQIPRALDGESLMKKASAFCLEGTVWENVNEALKEAMSQAAADDFIVICGSIFLVAEVNRQLIGHQA